MSGDLLAAWRATHVRRWHANPDLAHTVDPVGWHGGRVALLALMLWPERPGLLAAALLHDMGEWRVGDIPQPAKARDEAFAQRAAELEAEGVRWLGLPEVALDGVDALRLRLVDRLDAWLWARHWRPGVLAEGGWLRDRADLLSLAWGTGVGAEVEALLEEAGG